MSGHIDLVCWDFGDTLVDERFMRICPPGVPEWARVFDDVLAELGDFDNELMLGRRVINDLIPSLAARLPMSRAAVSRHLRTVWRDIEWFDEARAKLTELQGQVLQAVVTVNPYEFHGIATACGLDLLVDVIVTSADLTTLEKAPMAAHARSLLGLQSGLGTTILIDNKLHNVTEFVAAGGQAVHFQRATFAAKSASELQSNRMQFVETARNTPSSD